MDKKTLISRLVTMGVITIGFMTIITFALVELQLVNGESYRLQAERRLTRSSPEKAARGKILDRYGRPLVTSRMAFVLRIDYAFWDKEKQNENLLAIANLLIQNDTPYYDSFPISESMPFALDVFESEKDKEKFEKFLTKRKIDLNGSAEKIIADLSEYYDLQMYNDNDRRIIIGLRYEMIQAQFSLFNSFTLASDVSIDVVSKVKEQSAKYKGVVVDVEPVREYNTDYAAHILGRAGPIYKEEYEEYKKNGYPMNAIVGKDGMEKVLEPYLRGIDGTKSVVTNISGNVVEVIDSNDPKPGNNVMLTLDIGLQEVVEISLAETMDKIRKDGETARNNAGKNAEGAAAVVLDVRTSEVLAMASYPSYSLKTFNKDYKALSEDKLKPMFNRAIAGTYAPGSTYKMVTSIAGLEEGVITTDTKILDKGIYSFYAPSYTPQCWVYREYGRTHGNVNVSEALKHSCNYFYYETGRLLTAEIMEKYALKLGLGEPTGIELSGEAKGRIAGPTSRADIGGVWYGGDTLGAAIGQSDHQFSPVQMANYVASIINGGKRNRVHLLKSVRSYDFSDIIYESDTETLEDLGFKDSTYEAVMKGMENVVNEGGTAASVFRGYPIEIAGKTGSAQINNISGSANGVFIAYAPADNPEIVVCVVGEKAGGGNQIAYAVRDIFDYYFNTKAETEEIDKTYTLIE